MAVIMSSFGSSKPRLQCGLNFRTLGPCLRIFERVAPEQMWYITDTDAGQQLSWGRNKAEILVVPGMSTLLGST